MKRLVALILFGLGCSVVAAPSEAGGLPDPVMLVQRVGLHHMTHAMHVSASGKPENVQKIQQYQKTHSMHPSSTR